MCDRYSFTLSKEKTIRRFGLKIKQVPAPNFNFAPGMQIPAIMQQAPVEITLLHWGMDIPQVKDPSKFKQVSVISTDPLPSQPSLHELLTTNRCIIPADGFYLWKRVSKKGKLPYRVVLKWSLPFAMAGVWNTSKTKESQKDCSILTTSSTSVIQHISKHMPAILPLEHEKAWLYENLSAEETLKLLLPYPAENMKAYPVSAQLLQANENSELLTKPAQPTDQFGNYILFEDL
ncbi:SOS response-associated peptidase [Rhodocytophaga aerolata]|uniref:Abasic site processing protein n=1 Tax=Rhodocytophaga aerolata TaxID=455078 RepID=A0ABT8R5L9_9BACT|nr:SOS response-associated peptidase [Rhodocytophaga aerolata]MDO1447390.1 SOS response-associated peptidase [Rhodocytophaga aerolata]